MGRKKDVGAGPQVADGAGVRLAPLAGDCASDGELDEDALEAPKPPRRQRSEAQIAAFERMRAARLKPAPTTPKPAPKPPRAAPAPPEEPDEGPDEEPQRPAPSSPKLRRQRSDKGRPRGRKPVPQEDYSEATPVPYSRRVNLGHNLYSNFIIV